MLHKHKLTLTITTQYKRVAVYNLDHTRVCPIGKVLGMVMTAFAGVKQHATGGEKTSPAAETHSPTQSYFLLLCRLRPFREKN